MPPANSYKAAVPSAPLIRFLRSQIDCLAPPTIQCSVYSVQKRPSEQHGGQRPCVSVSKNFSTASKRHATLASPSLESSVLSLELLRPSANSSLRSSIHEIERRLGVSQSYDRLPDHFSAQRWLSRSSRPLIGRFLGIKTKEPEPELRSDDVLSSGTFVDHLGRSTKVANELKLRCTELDENGNVTLVNGEFKKSELIAKVRGVPFERQAEANSSSMVYFPGIFERSIRPFSLTSSSVTLQFL